MRALNVRPHRKYQPWTKSQLNQLWQRMRDGETADALAAEHECTRSNLYKQLREAGLEPSKLRRARQRDDVMASKIYTLRMSGKSFPEIADEFGMEQGDVTIRRLYMRLVRYCERAGAKYPHMPRKRGKSTWKAKPRDVTEQLITTAVKVIDEHAARSRLLNNVALAKVLGENVDFVKKLLGTMRRRKLIADGLAPTPAGLRRAAEIGNAVTSKDVVLARAAKTWVQARPCESLTSLLVSTSFSRSTVNVAIIRLRDEELLYPRGLIIPRKVNV